MTMPQIMIDQHARRKRFAVPRKVVLTAIVQARGRIPLAFGAFGDGRIQRDGDRWAQYNDCPVNLFGIIAIAWDMRAVRDDELPHETIARHMGKAPESEFWDGLSAGWTMTIPTRPMSDTVAFNEGFELGAEARFAASLICECGRRRFKAQPCDWCGK
jgi:hypothetical protein